MTLPLWLSPAETQSRVLCPSGQGRRGLTGATPAKVTKGVERLPYKERLGELGRLSLVGKGSEQILSMRVNT